MTHTSLCSNTLQNELKEIYPKIKKEDVINCDYVLDI